jgi:hypothetical protein
VTDLQRRVPGATIGKASCDPMQRRRFLATLKAKQRRGEIGAVWTTDATEAESIATGRFVVAYTRLAAPRPRGPLYATLSAAALGTLITVGLMVWHARYVLLTLLAIAVLTYLATRQRSASRCRCIIIHICGH